MVDTPTRPGRFQDQGFTLRPNAHPHGLFQKFSTKLLGANHCTNHTKFFDLPAPHHHAIMHLTPQNSPTMKNLPTTHPAEVLEISPEALEIANCYLTKQSAQQVADELSISTELVTNVLARREVKAYIDQVFFDTGFNNRFRMRDAMDAIIQKKFQELDEADVGSGKDILEILALSHKMTMETLDRQIQLEKLKGSNLRTQTNIQINETGGSNYHSLIERLVKSNA